MQNHIKQCRAFTIAELLVSMAIMAMILTAVAVAFSASATNLEENKEIYQNTTMARMALTRMTTQIRTAAAVQTTTAGTVLDFNDINGTRYFFHYDSGAKKLYVDTGARTNILLCENVKELTFIPKTGKDSKNNTVVQNVRIQMSVSSGDNDANVATSVTVRKALPF
jgi:prepilin-type N-terminal cleavage/methylation domain-containing protein